MKIIDFFLQLKRNRESKSMSVPDGKIWLKGETGSFILLFITYPLSVLLIGYLLLPLFKLFDVFKD